MSGSVALIIRTGQDWGFQFSYKDSHGDPVAFSAPRMEMREDLNPNSRLIATPTLNIIAPGVLVATLTKDQTLSLTPGNGFWDAWVTIDNLRVPLLYGTVEIIPHVTAAA